jgi:hypothetical protein
MGCRQNAGTGHPKLDRRSCGWWPTHPRANSYIAMAGTDVAGGPSVQIGGDMDRLSPCGCTQTQTNVVHTQTSRTLVRRRRDSQVQLKLERAALSSGQLGICAER